MPQFPLDGGQVLGHAFENLIPVFFIRHAQNPGHHFVIEISDQVSHQDDVIAHGCSAIPGDLATFAGDQVVNRTESCRNAQFSV